MKISAISLLIVFSMIACTSAHYISPIDSMHMSAIYESDAMAKRTTESITAVGEEKTIRAAMDNVRYGMKDPDSAKFRNVRLQLHAMTSDKIVCGEVNGKNSYGAYVGFVKFIASPDSHYIQDTSSRSQIMDAANAGLDRTCYR